MRNKLGNLCMVIGAVLVLAALSLFYLNQKEARQAEASVEDAMSQLLEAIYEKNSEQDGEIQEGDILDKDFADALNQNDISSVEGDTSESRIGTSGYQDPYNSTMSVITIGNYDYIGYLSIPALGLELPVISGWSYSKLRSAPCRYSGAVNADDLVIAAHNYSRHFGHLSSLSVGETVTFTDVEGITTIYEVVSVDNLAPTAVEEMTAGEYDLTLFTCNYSGQSRITVRCERLEE